MTIELEGKENLLCLVPGIYQEDIRSLYHQGVLGIMDDKVVLYNDLMPDSSVGGNYVYKIKAELPLSEVMIVLIEELKGVKKLIYNKRIHFVAKNQEQSIFFCIQPKAVKKYLKRMLKVLKAKKIDTDERTQVFEN